MSAYIVSDEHLDAILKGCQIHLVNRHIRIGDNTLSFGSEEDLTKMGGILKCENYRGVNARYNEQAVGEPYEYPSSEAFFRQAIFHSAIQLLKLCECYEYQSCENDDYQQTDAAKIIEFIRYNLIKFLPGYDEAKWSL